MHPGSGSGKQQAPCVARRGRKEPPAGLRDWAPASRRQRACLMILQPRPFKHLTCGSHRMRHLPVAKLSAAKAGLPPVPQKGSRGIVLQCWLSITAAHAWSCPSHTCRSSHAVLVKSCRAPARLPLTLHESLPPCSAATPVPLQPTLTHGDKTRPVIVPKLGIVQLKPPTWPRRPGRTSNRAGG